MTVRQSIKDAVASQRGKQRKADVDYTVNGTDKEHCGNCKHYVGANECERVAGYVAHGGWCKLWKSRK
jgi:hypothetical protein